MPALLSFKSSGEFVTSEEWNELVLTLQRVLETSDGFNDGFSQAVDTDRGWQEDEFAALWAGTGDLLPWSVVQLEDSPGSVLNFVEPVYQKCIDYNDSPLLITNGPVKVTNGDPFTALRVGWYKTRVRYDGASIPDVGTECGPVGSSGLVSSAGTGLVCLSKPDPSGTYIYVLAIGGGGSGQGSGKAVQVGKLSGDTTDGTTVTVPLVDDDLAALGSSQDNVINNTGVTLLQNSYVYIYEHVDWPVVGTATHSMFPARLEECPPKAAGSTTDLQFNNAGFLAGGGPQWDGSDIVVDGGISFTGSQSIISTSNGNISILPNGTGKIALGNTGTPTSLVTIIGDSTRGGDFQIANNWGAATNRSGILVGRPDAISSQIRLVRNGASVAGTRLGLAEANGAFLYTDAGGANEAAHFGIGTSAAVPLVLSTNDAERFRLASDGTSTLTKSHTDLGTPFCRLDNTSATGQSPFEFYINGTMRGKVRADYVGNVNYIVNGGDHNFWTGGDAGSGTVKAAIASDGTVTLTKQHNSLTVQSTGHQQVFLKSTDNTRFADIEFWGSTTYAGLLGVAFQSGWIMSSSVAGEFIMSNRNGPLVFSADTSFSRKDLRIETTGKVYTLADKQVGGNFSVGTTPGAGGYPLSFYKPSTFIANFENTTVNGNTILSVSSYGAANYVRVGANYASINYCTGDSSYPFQVGRGVAGGALQFETTGDVTLLGAAAPSGGGGKTLSFADNTSDPTPGTNSCCIYGKDVSGTVEVFVCDEGGTASQISPHATDGPPGIYTEIPGKEAVTSYANIYRGEIRWINLEKSAVVPIIETFAEYNTRRGLVPGDVGYKEQKDWTTNQNELKDKRDKEIRDWKKNIARRDRNFNAQMQQWYRQPLHERLKNKQDIPRKEEHAVYEKPNTYTVKPNPWN